MEAVLELVGGDGVLMVVTLIKETLLASHDKRDDEGQWAHVKLCVDAFSGTIQL